MENPAKPIQKKMTVRRIAFAQPEGSYIVTSEQSGTLFNDPDYEFSFFLDEKGFEKLGLKPEYNSLSKYFILNLIPVVSNHPDGPKYDFVENHNVMLLEKLVKTESLTTTYHKQSRNEGKILREIHLKQVTMAGGTPVSQFEDFTLGLTPEEYDMLKKMTSGTAFEIRVSKLEAM